ncbi:hypothetical protein B0T16DRAFT_498311 [Cercophora newfieldiana]|uniref:Rhodopsin domain-containing protein n=1 Tax=Cercophora newfieldiana TaxID=92897 RepID=A0AA39YLV4_9PEZI|nr:hypothetical protein B0T16DRAFT_498311 [Cercophora newfieldiana]
MSDFVQKLAVETWTLWTLGALLIACRMVSRRMRFRSWANLQIEDWLMMVVAVTFTAVMVCLGEVAKNGSNFISDEVAASLTPEEKAMAIYGSKMALAMEMCALATIWLVKICLLILYHRLTLAYHLQHSFVKLIFVYCVLAYAIVVILLLGYWCTPIQGYWALPVENCRWCCEMRWDDADSNAAECATFYKHMITATSFNISSDLMLLCIPIPIVVQSRIPLKRKLILCCVLGLGCFNAIFQILIAILNRYYNFSNPNDLVYTYWYVAEMATAVYVGNIPLCWQFIAHVFKMGTWASFGSEEHPAAPPPKNEPGTRRERKRFIHSMLPASLWSTNVGGHGETTIRGNGTAAAPTRISKTISEEAIMRVDEDHDIELATRQQRKPSWTSTENVPSRGDA